jgi:hypothetical protein
VLVGAVGAALALATSAFASTSVSLTIASKDPYKNTSSFQKTQVEPDTFSWGNTIVGTFQTGRFTDGGSSNIGWATSTDNGATWTHGFLPKTTVYASPKGPWDRISDPAVAYDAKHDVWMIEGLTLTGTTGEDVIISRSTDGGLTWNNPVTAAHNPGTFFDKSWVACDDWSSSPNYGNCYVEYDDAGAGDVMKMVRSTDGGQTWTASSVASAFGLGGQPLALPNGTVVVPYAGSGIESLVSTDGGKTYSTFHVASVSERGPAGNLRSGGGLPSAEVDAAGKVYVVWFDCRFRSGCATDDIVMSTSTDGKNWSSVVRIPIDAGQLRPPRPDLLFLSVEQLQLEHVQADRGIRVLHRRGIHMVERDHGGGTDEADQPASDESGVHGRRLHLDVDPRQRQRRHGVLVRDEGHVHARPGQVLQGLHVGPDGRTVRERWNEPGRASRPVDRQPADVHRHSHGLLNQGFVLIRASGGGRDPAPSAAVPDARLSATRRSGCA